MSLTTPSRRALLRGLAASAAVPLAGCPKINLPGLGDLSQFMPKVTFKKLKVTDINFQRVDTDFIFNIENPNPVKVNLGRFSYALDLGGKRFIDGSQQDGIALESRGDSKLVLPVGTAFADLFNLVGTLKGKDNVPFNFSGEFGFNTPLGEIPIPFKNSGDFPVLQPPKIRLAGLKLGKVNLLSQTANLALSLGVTQSGGSPMPLSNFGYAINLGGKPVVDGVLASLGEVGTSGEKVVEIPIAVKLLNLGTTIANAITRKEKLQVGLGADLTVGTPFGALPLHIDETGKLQIT